MQGSFGHRSTGTLECQVVGRYDPVRLERNYWPMKPNATLHTRELATHMMYWKAVSIPVQHFLTSLNLRYLFVISGTAIDRLTLPPCRYVIVSTRLHPWRSESVTFYNVIGAHACVVAKHLRLNLDSRNKFLMHVHILPRNLINW